MNKYNVSVFYTDEVGEKRIVGSVITEAKSYKIAKAFAIDNIWDTRMDCAGCYPSFKIMRVR
jgi:hypothetical protein